MNYPKGLLFLLVLFFINVLSACNSVGFSSLPTESSTHFPNTLTPNTPMLFPSQTATITNTSTRTPLPTKTSSPTPVLTATPFAGHSELFYSERITENKGEIYSLDLVTSEKTLIFDQKKFGLPEVRKMYEISGSPLGTYLVFSLTYKNDAEEVILFNRKTGKINKIYSSSTSDHVEPRFIWSEDESMLFFTVYGERIYKSETIWTHERSLLVYSPIINTFAYDASEEDEQYYIQTNSSYKKGLCTPDWSECLRTVLKVPTVGLMTHRLVISPDKNRFLLVYYYEKLEGSDNQQDPEIQIGLFDLLSKNNTVVTTDVTDFVKPIFSTDGRHIFYDYYPESIFGESYLYMYNIQTGEKVELLHNIDAFGVQTKGFKYVEKTTPTPKTPSGPTCNGEVFYDKKGDANMAYVDILEGSCFLSNKSLNVSIKLNLVLKTVDLRLIRGLKYQIILKPPLGLGGIDHLINISPLDGSLKGTMDDLFGCKFGEYQDSTFKYIADCNMEIDTEKNSITINIEYIDILPDSRLGFFTNSGQGKDSFSWEDMERP